MSIIAKITSLSEIIASDSDNLLTIRFMLNWNQVWAKYKPDLIADDEAVYSSKIMQCVTEMDAEIVNSSEFTDSDKNAYQQWKIEELLPKFQDKKFYSLSRRKKLGMLDRLKKIEAEELQR